MTSSATFCELLNWALQSEVAEQIVARQHGHGAAGAARRVAHIGNLLHEAVEAQSELLEVLPAESVVELLRALSRALRAAEATLLAESQIEHHAAREWRRQRPGDGSSIADYLPLIDRLPRTSPRARARRSPRLARRSSGSDDDGDGGPGQPTSAGDE